MAKAEALPANPPEPPASADDGKWAAELFGQAQDILRGNDKNGRYTVPAAGMYPHQWLWDSCFIAIG
ncbi:MAG: glycoside hydrolase, partial [Candidatus Saccharimonadales bacterium]